MKTDKKIKPLTIPRVFLDRCNHRHGRSGRCGLSCHFPLPGIYRYGVQEFLCGLQIHQLRHGISEPIFYFSRCAGSHMGHRRISILSAACSILPARPSSHKFRLWPTLFVVALCLRHLQYHSGDHLNGICPAATVSCAWPAMR